MMGEGWTRSWSVVIGALAAVLVFAAVPSVLVAVVGVPLPHQWTRAAVVSWRGAFDLLAVVAWVAWMVCATSLLRSVVTRVRARDTTSAHGIRVADQLSIRIAAAVLAMAPIAAATATSGAAVARVPAAVGLRRPEPSSTAVAVAPASSAPQGASWTVEAGDSLWSIADQCYDDGGAWQAIAAANLGHLMDDGTRFVDPSLIRPGWVLVVPPLDPGATSGAPAPANPGTGATTDEGPLAEPSTPDSVQAAPTSFSTPAASPLAGGSSVAPTSDGSPKRAPVRDERRAPHTRTSISSRPGTRQGHAPPPDRLPELAGVGVGALAAALLARRVRRARRLASFARTELAPAAPPSTRTADLAMAIGPFDQLPALDMIELAMRHLTAVHASEGGGAPLPPVRLVRAGPDGVELVCSSELGRPPDPWVVSGPSSLLLPSSYDVPSLQDVASGHDPWCPVLVPVGDNDTGTWLVALSAGSCLPVLGAEAQALVSAMRTAAGGWTWHEQLVVTDDAALANAECAAMTVDSRLQTTCAVVYVGDVAQLAPATRARCAVITTSPVQASDVTVVVDSQAASLHPLGITVRPHLLGSDWSEAAQELTSVPSSTGALPVTSPHADAATDAAITGVLRGDVTIAGDTVADLMASDRRTVVRPVSVAAHPAPSTAGRLGPGQVEIRLLTAVPRMDGLASELPPKRARRALELTAYLALHHPDPVTGDRLRTRVLGTTDADAAAKTLFNTAGAARRALGAGPTGDPLLPPATRAGHYRLSSLVTVDAARATRLVGAGLAASEPDEAMALLRAALDLVEGEPLSGTLTGYGWWRAEGHERRLADQMVDGACHLVRTALRAGHVDLARWALGQARRVEPYSEALARAAMQVAAASGDARRLQVEWQECQRLVDEVDPGGVPSEVTERLYGQLRQRLATGLPPTAA